MSGAADRSGSAPDLSPSWDRLGDAAARAVDALHGWRCRALEAEAEAARLRSELEALASAQVQNPQQEVQRLRAELAALRSRMVQARIRVRALLMRLPIREMEP